MMTIHINPIADPLSFKKNAGENGQAAIDTRRDAWRRAMEREQASNWLQHGLIERDRYVVRGPNREDVVASTDTRRQDTDMKKLSNLNLFVSNTNYREPHFFDSYGLDKNLEIVDVENNKASTLQESRSSAQSPASENRDDWQLVHGKAALAEATDPNCHRSMENVGKTTDINFMNPSQALSREEAALTNSREFLRGGPSSVQMNAVQVTADEPAGLQQQLLKLMVQLGVDASIAQEPSSLTSLVSKPELSYSSQIQAGTSVIFGESLSAGSLEIDLDQNERPQTISSQKAQRVQRDSLRFHTQLSEDGVQIWMGIDAGSTIDLAMLSQTLRSWLSQQGIQLRGLVCNGRPLFEREQGATSKQLDGNEQQGFDSLSADRVKNHAVQSAVNLNFKRMGAI